MPKIRLTCHSHLPGAVGVMGEEIDAEPAAARTLIERGGAVSAEPEPETSGEEPPSEEPPSEGPQEPAAPPAEENDEAAEKKPADTKQKLAAARKKKAVKKKPA